MIAYLSIILGAGAAFVLRLKMLNFDWQLFLNGLSVTEQLDRQAEAKGGIKAGWKCFWGLWKP